MNSEPPDEFFDMSAALTGFTVPTLKISQQSADFYAVFDEIYGAGHLSKLLAFYKRRVQMGEPPDKISAAILDNGSPVADTARALMAFWYLGQVAPRDDPENLRIPSGNHYARALVWRAIQAHPTGISTLRFGHWATLPPPLDEYL